MGADANAMNTYIDLLITGGALTVSSGEPTNTQDRHCIGQDIKHAIMESGLARKLLAERSPTLRADVMTQIELLVEEDTRLVPGSIKVKEESSSLLRVTANTYEFGQLEVTV
jgi:hypothetical protein